MCSCFVTKIYIIWHYGYIVKWVRAKVFNAVFSNNSIMSLRSFLLVEVAGVISWNRCTIVTGFYRLMGCFINVTCFEYYMMNVQSIIYNASIKGDHVMSNNLCYTTFLVSDKEKLFWYLIAVYIEKATYFR